MASGTGDNIMLPLVVIVGFVSLLTVFATAISSVTYNEDHADTEQYYSSLGEYEPFKQMDGSTTGYRGENYTSSGGGISEVNNQLFVTVTVNKEMKFVNQDESLDAGDSVNVWYVKGNYTGLDNQPQHNGFLISKHWGLWSVGVTEVTDADVIRAASGGSVAYVPFTIPGDKSFILIITAYSGDMAADLASGNININVGVLTISNVQGTDLVGTLIGLLTGNFFGNFLNLPFVIMAPISAVIDIVLAYIGLRLIGIISPL